MSVDFVHCNNCFVHAVSGIQFFLTQCGKIYCQNCLQSCVEQRNCAKCGSACKSIALVHGIKPDIEICFRDLSHSLKKLINVESFQKTQRNHYIEGLLKMNNQMKNQFLQAQNDSNQLKMKMNQMQSINDKLNNELIALRNENNSLKSMLDNNKKSKREKQINGYQSASPAVSVIRPIQQMPHVQFKNMFDFDNESPINSRTSEGLFGANPVSKQSQNSNQSNNNNMNFARSAPAPVPQVSARSRITLQQNSVALPQFWTRQSTSSSIRATPSTITNRTSPSI